MSPRVWEASYGPLNGQQRRQESLRELLTKLDFHAVVETGTYLGETTLWFRHVSGLPTYSVESSPRYFTYARSRCATETGINIELMDSRSFISRLTKDLAGESTLFYLDAHWQSDVPRIGELEIIRDNWSRAVVVIDDFKVAGDSGYEYVTYAGRPLNEAYLPDMPGWTRYYPSAPSTTETGAKRGMAVLFSPLMNPSAHNLTLLRPAP